MKLQNEIDCKQKKSQIQVFEEELQEMKNEKNEIIKKISKKYILNFSTYFYTF